MPLLQGILSEQTQGSVLFNFLFFDCRSVVQSARCVAPHPPRSDRYLAPLAARFSPAAAPFRLPAPCRPVLLAVRVLVCRAGESSLRSPAAASGQSHQQFLLFRTGLFPSAFHSAASLLFSVVPSQDPYHAVPSLRLLFHLSPVPPASHLCGFHSASPCLHSPDTAPLGSPESCAEGREHRGGRVYADPPKPFRLLRLMGGGYVQRPLPIGAYLRHGPSCPKATDSSLAHSHRSGHTLSLSFSQLQPRRRCR